MTKTLAANGLRLAYDSFGEEDAEAILLIAGLGTQRVRWTDPFCRALAARGYRVLRFDNRDTGGSTHLSEAGRIDFATLMAGTLPRLPYTLGDMARDALGLMDALSIGRAHVVGRSMGGMIAQILASEHPRRVRSLTSIMSSTGNPALPGADPEVMALLLRPAPDPAVDEAGFLAQSLAFARRLAGSRYPLDEAAHLALLREELRNGRDPDGFGRQLAATAMAGDRRQALARIQTPALVIHGSEDPLIPPACGRDTAEAIPGAEFLPVEGMGHDLPAPVHPLVIGAIDRLARKAAEA